MPSEQPPSDATNDIFSLSDRILAEKLLFVKEVRSPIQKMILAAADVRSRSSILQIGFGNWGSVWLCRPRASSAGNDTKLAVKLVHRSKTATTAARVRSLLVSCVRSCYAAFLRGFSFRWNEMKVVRTFKNDPHPSIVPFHSFIITPSYALITM
jgi:hypothetical protein